MLATGKEATFASGSTKWSKIKALANRYQQRWAREPGVDWNSLYDPSYSLGTVTATDTFEIDNSEVRKISDKQGDVVRILHTNGVNYSDYSLVPANTLKSYYGGQTKQYPHGFYATQIGSNLVFNHTFTSTSPQFGGTIIIPAYLQVEPLANDTDDIAVNDPEWLVTVVAAEYVRNDLTRQNQYPTLLAQANELMQRMLEDNESQIDELLRPWNPLVGRLDSGSWSNNSC